MKTLTTIPYAGLGNRIRAIASGVFISQILNAESTIIYWNKTKDCYANFHDLFKPIALPNIILKENTSLLNKIATKNNLFIPKIIQKLYYDQCIYNFNKNKDGDITNIIKAKSKLLLYSCHSMSNHYNLKNIFIPTNEIEAEIKDVTKAFNNTIGVHIRRTDNINSIQQSSNESFIKKLNQEIDLNNKVQFYLATDDIQVKKFFLKTYGDRIITCWDDIDRNTLKGMKSAVKDLFCLSSTNKIIGSAYSSYSEIAAELGNISLEIAK